MARPIPLSRRRKHAPLRARAAERATVGIEAVLEVLAMRISEGQVADLAPFIPVELRPALQKASRAAAGRPSRSPWRRSCARSPRRERQTRAEAFKHARAVFAVLGEVAGEKEFRAGSRSIQPQETAKFNAAERTAWIRLIEAGLIGRQTCGEHPDAEQSWPVLVEDRLGTRCSIIGRPSHSALQRQRCVYS